MANVFLDLPVPTTAGTGTPVDVSGLGRVKTVTVLGNITGTITIQFSVDGTNYFPLKTFTKPGKFSLAFAAEYMRVKLAGLGSGAENVDVGSDDIGQQFVTLPAPAGDGVGASQDVSALGTLNTIAVTGSFGGTVTIEISEDGNNWAQAGSFSKAGYKTAEFVAQFMRVRRSGVGSGGGGTPSIAVGAVNDSASGGAGAPAIFTYQPGGTDQPGVYTDWATLYAELSATDGHKVLAFDHRFSWPCVIPAGAYDMQNVTWQGLQFPWGDWSYVRVSDGVTFTNLKQFRGPLYINSVSTAPVVTDLSYDEIYLDDNVDIRSSTAPFFDLGNWEDAYFHLEHGSRLSGPAIGATHGNNGVEIWLHSEAAVSDPVAGTGILDINYVDRFPRGNNQWGSFVGQLFESTGVQRVSGNPSWTTDHVVNQFGPSQSAIVRIDASGGPVQITMQNINPGTQGTIITFKEVSGSPGATMMPRVGDTVDGGPGPIAIPPGGARTFWSDGTSNWLIIGGYL
jgi:hypothetical protein